MISDEQKKKLEDLYQSFLHNENILKMKDIPMHRGSNCYIHSFKVAKRVMRKAEKKDNLDYESLLTASILHDYYLYDWRTNKALKKKHGRRHPFVANENAKKDFAIPEAVSSIMLSHMWPLTPQFFPKTKEAKLLNHSDHIIATKEFITGKRFKNKREAKYLSYIGRLFD